MSVNQIYIITGNKQRHTCPQHKTAATLALLYNKTAFYYTGCPGGNVLDFGRMLLTLKYTAITQNTYIWSWTVTEIMAREVWKYDSCYTLIDYQIHIKTGRNM